MKNWLNKIINKSHCILFGHEWCNKHLPDGNGWVEQFCPCGAKRLYNVITKTATKRNDYYYYDVEEKRYKIIFN